MTPPISDKQAAEIAAALKVDTDSEHVADVLRVIQRFDGREKAMAEIPAGDHRARDIETLHALASAMEGMNANVLRRLVRYGVDLTGVDSRNVAEAARLAAEKAQAERPPRQTGRRPTTSRAIAFRDLASIFVKATGRRATIGNTTESAITKGGQPSGPFFRFLRAAVAPVPALHALNDHALAAAAKRANPRTKVPE